MLASGRWTHNAHRTPATLLRSEKARSILGELQTLITGFLRRSPAGSVSRAHTLHLRVLSPTPQWAGENLKKKFLYSFPQSTVQGEQS